MPGIVRYSSAVLVASKSWICSWLIELIEVEVLSFDLSPADAVMTMVSSVSPASAPVSLAAAAGAVAGAALALAAGADVACEYAGAAAVASDAVARIKRMLVRRLN